MSWPAVPQLPLCCALVVAPVVSNVNGPEPLIEIALEQSSFAGPPATV